MMRHRKGVGLNGSRKGQGQSQVLDSSSSVQTPRASNERQAESPSRPGLSRLPQPAHPWIRPRSLRTPARTRLPPSRSAGARRLSPDRTWSTWCAPTRGSLGLLTTVGPATRAGDRVPSAGAGVADAARRPFPPGRTLTHEEPAGHRLIIVQRGTAGRAHVSDLCEHGVIGAADDAGAGGGPTVVTDPGG